jgi:hypothetical protein
LPTESYNQVTNLAKRSNSWLWPSARLVSNGRHAISSQIELPVVYFLHAYPKADSGPSGLIPRFVFGVDIVVVTLILGFCVQKLASRKKKHSDATSILLIPLGKD